MAAFESAKGLIRKEIGRQIKLRHVPELTFKLDTAQEYSRHIESILEGLDIKRDDETKDDETVDDETEDDKTEDDQTGGETGTDDEE